MDDNNMPRLGGEAALKPGRLLHLEFIRMVAIFLVLFNHTGFNGFFLFSVSQGSRFYWFYLFLSIFDRICIPLFFMVSGALLINKEESLAELYKKRVLRFAAVLLVVSVIYMLYFSWLYQKPLSLRECLVTLYTACASGPLWYLYTYLGILVMLPFIRKLARAMQPGDFVYMAVTYVAVVGILPVLEYLVSAGDTFRINTDFSQPIAIVPGVFCIFMGYFIERVLDGKYYSRRNVIIALAVGLAAIVVSCLMTHYRAQVMGECSERVSQKFHDNLSAVPAAAFFFACKYAFSRLKLGPRMTRLICFFGGTSFGLYLIERLIKDSTLPVFYFFREHIPVLLAVLIWISCACIVGSCIIALLKKIPGVGKYL